jgi:hypothetical protein
LPLSQSPQLTTTGPLGDVTLDSAQATVRIEQAATARLVTGGTPDLAIHATTTVGDITAHSL